MYIFIYVLWFLLALVIFLGVRFLLRNVKRKIYIDIIIIVVELFATLGCAFFVMLTSKRFGIFHPFVSALYIIIFMDFLARIIYLIILAISKKKYNYKTLSIFSISFSLLFLIFGIVNMQIVRPKHINIESNKINGNYKIAFISDMHIGSSQSINISKNTINKIKKENVDFIFLGGDIIDPYTKKEEMIEVLSEFKKIDVPKYYIYGNHDFELNFSIEEFKSCLDVNDIKILKDEFVSLNSELTLLGREDASRNDRVNIENLNNPYDNPYLIAIDHQPFKFKDNCKAKVDLQLSGHTHAGQLFPLRMIYDTQVYAYGKYKYNDSILNVSSGASGWLIPLRTEVGCEFEVINLKSKK